jgi:hypothetical protein
MHEYDVALKSILMRLTGSVLAKLTGFEVKHWHNVELPDVTSLHVDLLGETADGQLAHIELQSTNDPDMVWRMAEYGFAIRRRLGRWPEQMVLYVGRAGLNMDTCIDDAFVKYQCRIVDIRDMDAEPLLSSHRLDDNVIAILAGLADDRNALRRILQSIARSDPAARAQALADLTILAGLRKLGSVLKQEIKQMPILDDIMDHDLLGPEIRKGYERGYERGEMAILMRQIEKRFGPLPSWASQQIEALSAPGLEDLALRLLDVRTLEELLPTSK